MLLGLPSPLRTPCRVSCCSLSCSWEGGSGGVALVSLSSVLPGTSLEYAVGTLVLCRVCLIIFRGFRSIRSEGLLYSRGLSLELSSRRRKQPVSTAAHLLLGRGFAWQALAELRCSRGSCLNRSSKVLSCGFVMAVGSSWRGCLSSRLGEESR